MEINELNIRYKYRIVKRNIGLKSFILTSLLEKYTNTIHRLSKIVLINEKLEPIIIETKVSSGIAEEHRQQLRNYLRSAAKNDNAIIKKVKTGLVLNFKKNEVFTESVRQRKETQDIEIEVWTYEKNKFTQHYSNKKAEQKS